MRKSSAVATRDSHSNLYIPVYKELHTITSDNGSGPRSIIISQPLLDQYGGKVKAKIQLDLYGDNTVVLPMPEPNWSEADEQRRQQLLTEQRIAPLGKVQIGKVDFSGNTDQQQTTAAQAPKLDKAEALNLKAGPPPPDEPIDSYRLAP